MIGITKMPDNLNDLILSDDANEIEILEDPKSQISAVYVNDHMVLKAPVTEFSQDFCGQDFGNPFSSPQELVELIKSFITGKAMSCSVSKKEADFEV